MPGLLTSRTPSTDTLEADGKNNQEEQKTLVVVPTDQSGSSELTLKAVDSVSTEELWFLKNPNG